jgi:surfactin synthase thioesterase subunit
MLNRSSANPWVLQLRRMTSPRLRLFCFPYAGGSAAVYRTWPERLPSDVEVCPLRLPGREARLSEKPYTRIGDLVQTVAEALRPLLDLPFALFGHSMGAVAAFELARELRRRHALLPTRLFVSGARAPQRPNPDPPIHHLPDEEFVAEVRRRYDGIPGAVLENPELVQLLLPALRADFALFESYVYSEESPIGCAVSCFGGLDDDRVSREDLEAWSGNTAGSFSLRMFPGDHFFLHSAEESVRQAVCDQLVAA